MLTFAASTKNGIMAKNYFSRYVWLIDLIQRHGYITMPEINRAWRRSSLNEDGQDIPERTFFNQKTAINETFGIEIKCDRSLGYYIANSDNVVGDGMKNWLLQSLSMNNLMRESADMRGRILFEQIPSGQRFLTGLISAMRDGKAINLTYRSFKNPQPHTFEAEPYCVKVFKQRWYLLAKTPKWETPKIYALDRIVDIEELDKAFELPDDFDAEVFFSNHFGIIVGDGGKPEDVKLKVPANQVQYYDSLPLHHSQKKIEDTPEYSVFSYHIVPTFDFWQEIMSKGDHVEVLEPSRLRDWVADAAREMMKIYGE